MTRPRKPALCANFHCPRKRRCLRYSDYPAYCKAISDGHPITPLRDTEPRFVHASYAGADCPFFYPTA